MLNKIQNESKTSYSTLISAFVLALAGVGDAFLYIYLPFHYEEVGLSIFWVGVMLSINRVARLFLNGWVAYFVSKRGVKFNILIASIFALLTTLAYGWVNSILGWLIVRILWGLSFSILRLGNAMYALQERKVGFSLGLSRSIIEMGAVSVFLLAPTLTQNFDRASIFLLLGVLSAIGLLLACTLPEVAVPAMNRKEARLSFPSWLNALTFANAFILEGVLIVVLGKLLAFSTTWDKNSVFAFTGFLLAYRRLCIVFFSPIAGNLADSWGFQKIFDYTHIALLVGVTCLALVWNIAGVLIAFAFGAVNASMTIGSALASPASSLKAISDNTTWRDMGAAAGTFVGALLLSFTDISWVFALFVCLALAGKYLFEE